MKQAVLDFFSNIRDSIERGHRFIAHDVWRIGLPGEEVPHGLIIKQVRAVILLMRGLVEETLLLRASALTFATLLFLVPFFALMFSFIQTFNLGDQIYEKMDERLSKALVALRTIGEENKTISRVREIVGIPSGNDEGEDNSPYLPARPDDVYRGDASEGESLSPEESDEMLKKHLIGWLFPIFAEGHSITEDPIYQNPVKILVSLAEEGAKSPRTIGISGLLFILSTVFGFMRNVEYTLNRIWGVSRQRNPFRVLSDYLMITFLLPFVAAFIMGISAALESQYVLNTLGSLAPVLRGTQFIVLCMTFTIIYKFVPNTKVYFRYALLGGIVGGSLYMLNSWYYVKFQVGLVRYTPFFSTFALFPLLLMYIYFSWLILLFGSLVSFAYQNENTFAMERLSEHATQAYRESLAVRLMIEMARRFKTGAIPLTIKEAADNWNVPMRLLSDTLESLMKAKLVVECATTPPQYQPYRSTKNIKVVQVINAIREAGQDPSLFRKDKQYGHIYSSIDMADPAIMQADISSLAEQTRQIKK